VEFLARDGRHPRVVWYFQDSSSSKALDLLSFNWAYNKTSFWTSSLVPRCIKDSFLFHRLLAILIFVLKKRCYVLPEKHSFASASELLESKSIALLGFYHDFNWASDLRMANSHYLDQLKAADRGSRIGVHFRFGDFLEESLREKYGEVSIEYYESALQYICSIAKDVFALEIWVFTDDVKKAEDKINLLSSAHKFKISFAQENNLALEAELAFFASCRFLILSNSSFSWWAGYFSKEDATVIAPEPIYLNADNESVAPESWIRLPGY